jgi:thiol-disulfide isomerase/thioredoxin
MQHTRSAHARLTLGLGLATALACSHEGRAQESKSYAMPIEGSSSAAVTKALSESFPDRPEWVDMLTDILQNSTLGPNDGWFRTAVAQTRFDWIATRKLLDRDGDGRISREEFRGPDRDFARLDRNHDRALTEADFDFSPHAMTSTPGAQVFLRADADGNGKLTRDELDAFFKQCDSGGQGFLSLADLQEAFSAQPRPASTSTTKAQSGPSRETLVRALFNQELGSLQAGPALGETATDFTLADIDGKETFTLAKNVGPKPVVLVFGNITCGPFRSQAGNIEKLHRMYKDRATFAMVYVREAHPANGWSSEGNFRLGITLEQPRTYAERVAAAQDCGKRIGLGFPMLVDTIDDAVGGRYSGMPSRLYLIDGEGKVAYKSGRGPFGFKPNELEQSLILLLDQETTSPSPDGTPPHRRPVGNEASGAAAKGAARD